MSCPRSPPRWRTRPGVAVRRGIAFWTRALPELGVVHGRDRVAGLVLRVLEDVRDRIDGPDDGLLGLERVRDLLVVALADPAADVLVEERLVLDAAVVVAEPRLVDDLRVADQAHDPLGDRLGARRQSEPVPVARLVGVAGRGPIGAAAGPALDLPELVVDERLGAEQPEQRLVDREVDDLAGRAVHVPMPQGEHRPEGPEQRRHAVAERERRQRRRSVRLAVDVGEAADRLRDRAEPRARAHRAGLAVPRAAHDDEPGIDRVEDVRPEAPALERARPERFDEDVGIADELLQELSALGLAEVDRDEALVAVDERPPERHAVLLPAERPERVPSGMLDLDDVGAEVGEQRADDRASEQDGGVDDAQSLERSVRLLVR